MMFTSDTNNMRSLEQSISILELEDINAERFYCKETKTKTKKIVEHSQIFEDLVSLEEVTFSTEVDEKCIPSRNLHRQSSVPNQLQKKPESGEKESKHKGFIEKPLVRRHSSYEARQRRKNFAQHQDMKKYLETRSEKKMSSAIQKLIDFNLSVSMASSSDLSMCVTPTSLHYSCPVLSYMNDEEDSLDLAAQRQRKRRSTLCSLSESVEESWESLNDDNSIHESTEYEVTMKALNHDDKKPRIKRRRPYSCLQLSRKLEIEDPAQVLQSLIASQR
jgi:hypothetical protein